MYTGPKLTNNNLVFGHDTGYKADGVNLSSSRFYKGPPHTNLVEEIDPSYSATNTTNFFMNGGATEEVDIPQVGKRNVQYVEYFNNRYAADGSVNSGTTCCPNLFHYFASSVPYIAVDSSSNYTYSIIYKHSHNYHHPNFMYHYQKNSSNNTLTEGGVSSTNSDRRTHLGDGWYHAWGNIATQSTCTNVLLYSFLYNYGTVKHKYYVAALSFVKNTTSETYMKIPPHLMLEPLASVSNTASLIDLKRTKTLDLANVSHDEFAQPVFDGTDDYIELGNALNSIGPVASFEMVFKATETNDTYRIMLGWGNGDSNYSGIHIGSWTSGYTDESFHVSFNSSSTQIYVRKGHSYYKDNAFHHAVVTAGAGNYKIWIDGVDETDTVVGGTNTFSKIVGYNSNITTQIGKRPYGGGSGYFKGEIPVMKVHDAILTETEIKSNFNAYKKRFNI